MSVDPARHSEYRRRHDALWPEMITTLKAHGVQSYSIFLDETRSLLFAYAEIASEQRWQAVAETPACRRWWDFMKDIMPSNPDGSPVSQDLREVFHLA